MARWDDVPDEHWLRIFCFVGSYLDRARCLAVCTDWLRLGRQARPPLLPSLLTPSPEQGLSSLFDVVVRAAHLPGNAPSFDGRRVIGSFVDGRLAVAFTVADPTLYGIVDFATGEVLQVLPDRLRVPDTAELQSLAIQAITGGRGVYAAIISGEAALVFWREGMDAWCPPRLPAQGLYNDDDPRRFWHMMLPDCPIDDVHYSDATDTFFVLTIRQDLWMYRTVRLHDGGVAFEGHLAVIGPDFSGASAARYLCAGPEALLMVRRVFTLQQGTSELELFVLHTAQQGAADGAPEGWTSWRRLTHPTGLVMFLGRGYSKAYRSADSAPAFVFFLDDRDGYRRLSPTYRCVDTGRYRFDTQRMERVLPTGPVSDLSPFVWVLPPGGHIES